MIVGFVDDADEIVVELCADGVGVAGGVVALAAEDGDELGAGLEEAAAFADGLERQSSSRGRVQCPLPSSRRCAGRAGSVAVRALAAAVSASTAPVALKYWSATVVSAMRA